MDDGEEDEEDVERDERAGNGGDGCGAGQGAAQGASRGTLARRHHSPPPRRLPISAPSTFISPLPFLAPSLPFQATRLRLRATPTTAPAPRAAIARRRPPPPPADVVGYALLIAVSCDTIAMLCSPSRRMSAPLVGERLLLRPCFALLLPWILPGADVEPRAAHARGRAATRAATHALPGSARLCQALPGSASRSPPRHLPLFINLTDRSDPQQAICCVSGAGGSVEGPCEALGAASVRASSLASVPSPVCCARLLAVGPPQGRSECVRARVPIPRPDRHPLGACGACGSHVSSRHSASTLRAVRSRANPRAAFSVARTDFGVEPVREPDPCRRIGQRLLARQARLRPASRFSLGPCGSRTPRLIGSLRVSHAASHWALAGLARRAGSARLALRGCAAGSARLRGWLCAAARLALHGCAAGNGGQMSGFLASGRLRPGACGGAGLAQLAWCGSGTVRGGAPESCAVRARAGGEISAAGAPHTASAPHAALPITRIGVRTVARCGATPAQGAPRGARGPPPGAAARCQVLPGAAWCRPVRVLTACARVRWVGADDARAQAQAPAEGPRCEALPGLAWRCALLRRAPHVFTRDAPTLPPTCLLMEVLRGARRTGSRHSANRRERPRTRVGRPRGRDTPPARPPARPPAPSCGRQRAGRPCRHGERGDVRAMTRRAPP
ncbi:hypothetical protein CERSUDRAFT_100087 [Gelatoporia subvermispora B]|uniref:Uncharacterized protein n=1 Tax=Ceriporiopsis subvermispora (strain B) TaxID=914234 RepID=M2R0T3_CERS8|nr:hypothetical protein CERSUDRAFT_100087 [Gelatoporia subvermispora B]